MKFIKVLISVIFAVEGLTKIFAVTFQVNLFNHWGYPLWFMFVIGSLELLGAIGLWIPQLSWLANIGLIGLMIGALYTHLSRGDTFQMMGLAIIATILLCIHIVKGYKKV
jgi:putative oxidoreductase